MSRTPYIKSINPNSGDSHQASPGYCLTFVRWANRSTFNYTTPENQVRKSLVVINDAVSVTVSNTKASITPSMSATLLAGDINYSTAIHPGDFVFVNMVNWNTKVAQIDDNGKDYNGNSLRNRALAEKPINYYNDGFKGIFKVQTVRRKLKTDPSTGMKTYFYEIQAFGFTEFNTVIYYDPQIYSQLQGNIKLFMQQFDAFFGNVKSKKDILSVQDTMAILISALLGQGKKKSNAKIPNDTVTHFKVPPSVGNLLGVKADYAADIYNYIFGVWGSGSSNDVSAGFNPNITQDSTLPSNFYKTPTRLQGRKLIDAEYWNNVKIWSIITKYLNDVVNEAYTTFRVAPDSNRVMPTIIFRQKPFTSQHFRETRKIKQNVTPATEFKKFKVSRHLEMPRWKISPSLIYDIDLGKDEAARINFVQIYTRTVAANDARNRARQAGTKNYMFDIEDIGRSGLKPYLASANFDYPEKSGSKTTKGKEWADLVSDFLIDGHLREAGTISCQGIEEPISVGDNIELDDIVYHIEAVTHNMSVQPQTGRIQFRTNLTVSFGMHKNSDKTRPIYPEMERTDSFTNRKDDFNKGERILPGFSDEQNIGGRVKGVEVKETREASYTLNAKPKPEVTTATDGTTDEKDQTNDDEQTKQSSLKDRGLLDKLF
jgi:hypothetical protein